MTVAVAFLAVGPGILHQTSSVVTEINGVPQPMDSRFDTITVPSQIGDKPGSIRVKLAFTGPAIVWRFVFRSHVTT